MCVCVCVCACACVRACVRACVYPIKRLPHWSGCFHFVITVRCGEEKVFQMLTYCIITESHLAVYMLMISGLHQPRGTYILPSWRPGLHARWLNEMLRSNQTVGLAPSANWNIPNKCNEFKQPQENKIAGWETLINAIG